MEDMQAQMDGDEDEMDSSDEGHMWSVERKDLPQIYFTKWQETFTFTLTQHNTS